MERLLHYSTSIPMEQHDPETPAAIDEAWPPHGAIEFENVYLRYRPLLPLVLQGISFRVKPREKVTFQYYFCARVLARGLGLCRSEKFVVD